MCSPQTNGKTDQYNKKIVEIFLYYVSQHETYCGMYLQPLTFLYNTQVYRSTNVTSFSHFLSRHPKVPTDDYQPVFLPYVEMGMPADKLRLRLLSILYLMKSNINANLKKSQRWYNTYLNRSLKFIYSINKIMFTYTSNHRLQKLCAIFYRSASF